jgi:hypothetical protein
MAKTLDEMTKDEKSLLLFLETCVVDEAGLIDVRKMNAEDVAIAVRWEAEGFIGFGRVYSKDIARLSANSAGRVYSQWCSLSEEAWTLAHQERRARAVRVCEKRTWCKASEKQNE